MLEQLEHCVPLPCPAPLLWDPGDSWIVIQSGHYPFFALCEKCPDKKNSLVRELDITTFLLAYRQTLCSCWSFPTTNMSVSSVLSTVPKHCHGAFSIPWKVYPGQQSMAFKRQTERLAKSYHTDWVAQQQWPIKCNYINVSNPQLSKRPNPLATSSPITRTDGRIHMGVPHTLCESSWKYTTLRERGQRTNVKTT